MPSSAWASASATRMSIQRLPPGVLVEDGADLVRAPEVRVLRAVGQAGAHAGAAASASVRSAVADLVQRGAPGHDDAVTGTPGDRRRALDLDAVLEQAALREHQLRRDAGSRAGAGRCRRWGRPRRRTSGGSRVSGGSRRRNQSDGGRAADRGTRSPRRRRPTPEPRQGSSTSTPAGASASRSTSSGCEHASGGRSSATSSTRWAWSTSLAGDGRHHLDDTRTTSGLRIEQEADVVVAALHHDAASRRDARWRRWPAATGRRCRSRVGGRTRSRPGAASTVTSAAGRRTRRRISVGRRSQHDLDQRVRRRCRRHDEAGPPVALPAEEVVDQRRLGERDVDIGHRHLAVRAGDDVGHDPPSGPDRDAPQQRGRRGVGPEPETQRLHPHRLTRRHVRQVDLGADVVDEPGLLLLPGRLEQQPLGPDVVEERVDDVGADAAVRTVDPDGAALAALGDDPGGPGVEVGAGQRRPTPRRSACGRILGADLGDDRHVSCDGSRDELALALGAEQIEPVADLDEGEPASGRPFDALGRPGPAGRRSRAACPRCRPPRRARRSSVELGVQMRDRGRRSPSRASRGRGSRRGRRRTASHLLDGQAAVERGGDARSSGAWPGGARGRGTSVAPCLVS